MKCVQIPIEYSEVLNTFFVSNIKFTFKIQKQIIVLDYMTLYLAFAHKFEARAFFGLWDIASKTEKLNISIFNYKWDFGYAKHSPLFWDFKWLFR